MAESGCIFFDDAEWQCNTRWCALVLSLTCCQFIFLHCCSVLSLFSIKDGLQQCGEGCDGRHVQALLVMLASWNVMSMFFLCVFLLEGEECFSRHLCCRWSTQRTEVQALVMRFCVQLLLKRGAMTPASLNTVKNKTKNERLRLMAWRQRRVSQGSRLTAW